MPRIGFCVHVWNTKLPGRPPRDNLIHAKQQQKPKSAWGGEGGGKLKLFGYISFFPARREEEGRLLRHSASWKSWRIHDRLTFHRRRNSSVTTAATSRWRRRRKLKLLRVVVVVVVVVAAAGGSADPSNINTHGQMEAESHASVLASTDPSVHDLKPKRMHEYPPLQSRVIHGLQERGTRESTMPAPHLTLPRAWNNHNINSD